MKKKIVPFILIFVLLQSICMPVWAASQADIDKQNQDKSEIEQKKKDAKEKQDEVQGEMSEQRKQIASLDESIGEIEEELQTINGQVASLETSINQKTVELEKKQKEYEENDELLKERLVVMYEAGETSFLDILFGSANIVEFISNYYTLSQLTECDTELLQSIEKEQKEIEETKNSLEKEKTEVDTLKNEKEAKNNTLKNKKIEREEKLSSLSEEDKKLQSDIDAYEAQVKKIDSQIAQILENIAKKNNPSGSSGSSSSGTAGLKFDGSFIWPCNNKIITSTVKMRWGRWHKGLDIGARYENVYASASGYAYNLENPGGYGHYIMIVHGDGYITLYGHLNSYNISYGQYVKQGQVIAQSGNSGASQGAHLHFEIRKASSISNYFSSTFLNPLDYLPGGYTFAAGATTPS